MNGVWKLFDMTEEHFKAIQKDFQNKAVAYYKWDDFAEHYNLADAGQKGVICFLLGMKLFELKVMEDVKSGRIRI